MILQNESVLLRKIVKEDLRQLSELSKEMKWDYFPLNLTGNSDLVFWFDYLKHNEKNHSWQSFTIIDKESGSLAGSTSYTNFSDRDKRVEIGWTWLGMKYQGTGLNRNCKFLLLQHAFENMGMMRVEFKSDKNNTQSRKALKNIGAEEEGILRSHSLTSKGIRRDVVYYSILRSEWPYLKYTWG